MLKRLARVDLSRPRTLGALALGDCALATAAFMAGGRRYREGETTADGAAVEEITPDGVIMNSSGNRFLLSRD